MVKNKVRAHATNSLLLRLFMLRKLPLGLLVGLRVQELDENQSKVSVPFKYLNKNPFQSTYFAVQAMAAEFSTAVLAMSILSEISVPVSMLVQEVKATFSKKAKSRVLFHCEQGTEIEKIIKESVETGEGRAISVKSVGINEEGVQVAEFYVTWTFKPKNKE
jgi:acyl-coenzyme A thioesterase PaaI-like protein